MPPVTNATTNAMPSLEVGDEWLPKQKQMTAANLGKRKADGNCERKVPGFGGERHLIWGPNDERRLDEARNGPARSRKNKFYVETEADIEDLPGMKDELERQGFFVLFAKEDITKHKNFTKTDFAAREVMHQHELGELEAGGYVSHPLSVQYKVGTWNSGASAQPMQGGLIEAVVESKGFKKELKRALQKLYMNVSLDETLLGQYAMVTQPHYDTHGHARMITGLSPWEIGVEFYYEGRWCQIIFELDKMDRVLICSDSDDGVKHWLDTVPGGRTTFILDFDYSMMQALRDLDWELPVTTFLDAQGVANNL
jgi:hypothetical protein